MHILKHQQFDDETLLRFAENLSRRKGRRQERILHWEFGPVMNMAFSAEAQNYLFSSEKVPLHWDGAFYRTPSKLLFYCTESKGFGGESLFVDTTSIWNSLSESEKKECKNVKLKYSTKKVSHYGGSFEIDLVNTHPVTGAVILRLAEKVETSLNPVELVITGVEDSWGFYDWMIKKFYDPSFLYEHRWEKGDLLVVDNYRFLHGRRALLSNKDRSFKRIQIL